MSTIDRLTFCDTHSHLLLESHSISIKGGNYVPEVFKGLTNAQYLTIVTQLRADGFLRKSESSGSDLYYLTSDGRVFIEKGGYKTKHSEDEKLKKLQEDQISSAIIANTAVTTNISIQRRIGIRTLWIVGISGFISLCSVIISAVSMSDTKIQTELHSQVRLIDSLQNTLKNISATIKKFQRDTGKIHLQTVGKDSKKGSK